MKDRYFDLMIAIIKQAVEDYKAALRGKKTAAKIKTIRECEKFFLSKWGQTLTDGNGQIVIDRCRGEVAQEEREQNGRS